MRANSVCAAFTIAAMSVGAGCAAKDGSRPVRPGPQPVQTQQQSEPERPSGTGWTTVAVTEGESATTTTAMDPRWGEPTVRKNASGVVEAEGYMLDGKPNGPWTFYWPDGKRKGQGAYQLGERTGEWTFWNQDGTKATNGSFVNGKNDGAWEHWFPNGVRKAEQRFRHGLMHGTTRTWDEFGRIRQEITYDADIPVNPDGRQVMHGLFKEYAPNGTVIAEGPYDNGIREGVWIFRYPTGQIDRAGRYYHGEDLGLWLVGVEGENRYRVQKKISLEKGRVIEADFEMMTQVFGPDRASWPVPLTENPAELIKDLKPGQDLIVKPKESEEPPPPTPPAPPQDGAQPINPEPK